MIKVSSNNQQGVFRKIAFRLYAIARKTGLMRWPVIQFFAVKVYDIIRPKGELSVEVEGNTLYLKAKDRTITPILLSGEAFEKSETELCKRIIQPGMTVVDIGANIGYFSLLFAKLVGNEGKVISFEPEPDNFRLLQKNIEANNYSCVSAYNLALADEEAMLDLFVGEASQTTSTFVEGNILYEENVDRVAVQTVRLDSFLSEQNIGNIDFIKMDVQGFEETVLRGAEELLKNTSPFIIMEFWPYGLQKAGTKIEELLNTLVEYGYSFYLLDEKSHSIYEITREKLQLDLNYDDRFFINLFLKKCQ